jgi:hypothetical protein
MALFGPPNPEALKEKRNIKGLIKALSYKKDLNIRVNAARMLENLDAKDAIPAIVRQMETETDTWGKRRYAESLRNMGYRPEKGKAAYYALLGDYESSAASGEEEAFGELIKAFISAGESWQVYAKLGKAFLLFGEGAIPALTAFTDSLYGEYKKFTGTVREINFAAAEGKHKKAVIERFVYKLDGAARIISMFNHPAGLAYCESLYKRIRTEIYSVPDSYFSDIYDAEKLRTRIVENLNLYSAEHEKKLFAFLAYVMMNDEAFNVRWKAALVLEKHRIQAVKQDELLQGALRHVLEHFPQITNRSYYVQKIKSFIFERP